MMDDGVTTRYRAITAYLQVEVADNWRDDATIAAYLRDILSRNDRLDLNVVSVNVVSKGE